MSAPTDSAVNAPPRPLAARVPILVAEDSATQAAGLRHLLEKHHFHVAVVANGRLAQAHLAAHLPALVISDINMPELDGYALCRHIKADARLSQIPVILLTSLTDAEDVLEALACGADSFISKPYSDDYLLAHIERTLAAARLPPTDKPAIMVDIPIPGRQRVITADLRRMASLLISTYEAAINRNSELVQVQAELRALNDHLEALVEERTAVLTAEIAERQQAEARSRYLAGVLENISDAVVSTNLAGDIVSWNTGAEALLGYSAEEVLHQPYTAIVNYDYLDSSSAEAAAQLQATGQWHGEAAVRRQDGALIYVLLAAAVLHDSRGRLIGHSAVLHDISDRKRVELALAQSNDMLSHAEEIGDIGSWRWDMAANHMAWSASLYRLFGLAPDAFGATFAAYLERVHPDDRLRVQAIIANAHLAVGPIEFENRIVRADGEVRTHFTRAAIIRDDRGQPTHFLGLSMDVTERRQRDSELQAIVAIAAALRRANTQAEMLPIILEQVAVLLHTGAAALALRDFATDELEIVFGQGEMAGAAGLRLPAAVGIGGQVLVTGLPYVTDDVVADPHSYLMSQLVHTRAVACVPLITNQSVLGTLWAGRAAPFAAVEVRALSAIASIAASAIQRAGLHEQTERRLQRLIALREIDSAIMNSLDLTTTLNIVLGHVTSRLGVDAADILLFSQGLRTFTYAVGRGFRTRGIEQTRLRLGEGHPGRAGLERRMVSVPDLQADAAQFRRATLLAGESFVALYCQPLTAKGQLVGVLEVFQRAPLNPDAEWLDFFESLAGQAAIAVADAWLFTDLQRSNADMLVAYDTTLAGWSAALDLRDKETEGHSQRVSGQTHQLARALGVSDSELVHIRRGSLLHDIGKMGVPDAILHKPGPLTEAEWVSMRQHPQMAYELLAPISFLRPALDIPYCHHEKWDGTGYPRALKGDAIPLAARIFAVVDVWDALRSNRPYRPGWSEDKVLAYIRDQSGQHFDPQVVAAFLALIAERSEPAA